MTAPINIAAGATCQPFRMKAGSAIIIKPLTGATVTVTTSTQADVNSPAPTFSSTYGGTFSTISTLVFGVDVWVKVAAATNSAIIQPIDDYKMPVVNAGYSFSGTVDPYVVPVAILDASGNVIGFAGPSSVPVYLGTSTPTHFANRPTPTNGAGFLCDDVAMSNVVLVGDGTRFRTAGPILAASCTGVTGASSTSRQVLYSKTFPAGLINLNSKFYVDAMYETISSTNAKNIEIAILQSAVSYPILKVDARSTDVRSFTAQFPLFDDGAGNPVVFDYTNGGSSLSLPGVVYPSSGAAVATPTLSAAFTLEVAITCANATEAAATTIDNFSLWLTV